MLAPRKVLWSTPDAAIEKIYQTIPLSARDTVVDLGCGDGKVLLQWAELCTAEETSPRNVHESRNDNRHHPTCTAKNGPAFVGIDVDPDRIQAAEASWLRNVSTLRIDSSIPYQFHCANAVEQLELWRDSATVLYVYLTPRGMRQLRPILKDRSKETATLRVVSYMNPLPDATLVRRELVSVAHQPNAAWPLYFYEL